MINSILSVKGFFRIKDWWRSKASLLMGTVYLFTLWFDIGFEEFIPLSLLSIATISGFASFGYLLNDFFDREQDARAGKKNILTNKPPLIVLALFLTSFCLLFLPWRWLPFDRYSITLIVSQILLFIIYSMGPFRLKERGVAGLLTDALYAHALPVMLAAHTFSLAAGKPLSIAPVVLLFIWQLFSGIRNILIHQADDLEHDKKSDTVNFVTRIYPTPFFAVVRHCMIIELLFSVLFFGLLVFTHPLFSICLGVIVFLSGIAFVLFGDRGMAYLLLESKWKTFPNNIYEKWIPPAILLALTITDIRFAAILLLHFILFNAEFFIEFRNRGIRPLGGLIHAAFFAIIKIVYFIKGVIHAALSFLLNYSIYYCFLIFGVDLKKEKSSAFDYLKKLRGAKQR